MRPLLLQYRRREVHLSLKRSRSSDKVERLLSLPVVLKWKTSFGFFKWSYFCSSVWINVKAITSLPVRRTSCKQEGVVKQRNWLTEKFPKAEFHKPPCWYLNSWTAWNISAKLLSCFFLDQPNQTWVSLLSVRLRVTVAVLHSWSSQHENDRDKQSLMKWEQHRTKQQSRRLRFSYMWRLKALQFKDIILPQSTVFQEIIYNIVTRRVVRCSKPGGERPQTHFQGLGVSAAATCQLQDH